MATATRNAEAQKGLSCTSADFDAPLEDFKDYTEGTLSEQGDWFKGRWVRTARDEKSGVAALGSYAYGVGAGGYLVYGAGGGVWAAGSPNLES